MIVKTGHLESR